MDFLLPIPYAFACILILWKLPFFRIDGIGRAAMTAAFLIKIAAGTAMFFIYTRYYPERNHADIFKFFDDSRILYGALLHSPADFLRIMTGIGNDLPHFDQYYRQMNNWYGIYPSNVYGDGHLMIRYNALLRVISFGNYHVHTVITCFLAFSGLTALLKFFLRRVPGSGRTAFAGVFLLPSVVFWSSGVLKDGLIFFALGMILWQLDRQLQRGLSWQGLFSLLFCFVVLRYCKFYMFLFLFPLAAAFGWSHLRGGRRVFLKYLSVLILVFLAGSLAGAIDPVYDLTTILARKQQDFLRLAQDSGAGSLLTSHALQPGYPSVAFRLAPGFINSLTRPYPWEMAGPVMILPALENALIWMLILRTLFHLRRPVDRNLFWFSILFVIAIFSLTGLITPVSGAIVRYKAPALPFLLLLLHQVHDNSGSLFLRKKKEGVSLAKG